MKDLRKNFKGQVYWFSECLSGYFGVRCNKTCSGHCLNNSSCHPIDGTCVSGCQDGFTGNLCNACKSVYLCHCVHCQHCPMLIECIVQKLTISVVACRKGYYGRNCSRTCPSNCKACKATDGTCSCDAGWMGPNCSIGIFYY